MRRIVRSGVVPGLLGYADGEPVAWVSLGPRTDFAALETSRLLRRVDDRPVWSVVCFVVRPDQRRQGWMRRLLRAAAAYAADHGASLLEGYPVECGDRRLTGDGGYTGIASTFRSEGFREVARPRPDRPVMRKRMRPKST
jgi:GNAT superfamily N-acetyltransferase